MQHALETQVGCNLASYNYITNNMKTKTNQLFMTELITICIIFSVYMNKIIYGLLGIPTVILGLSPKCHLLIT